MSQDFSRRGEERLCMLELAFKRLLDGKPERTNNDGKINLSRINKEAGLSVGGIYYYKEFIEKVNKDLSNLSKSNSTKDIKNKHLSIQHLRSQRDKEKELKERYRREKKEMEIFKDKVISNNAQLHFALYEALEKIENLEAELVSYKVTDINRKK